jgi:hypothetical protein
MIFIDAHVHIHNCFDLDAFFDAAYGNFRAEAKQGGMELGSAFLLLTEGGRQHWFRQLQENGNLARNWRALPTGEPISLRLERRDRPGLRMYLAAGRQIVTAEKLEVLALLSGSIFEDGKPLGRTVAEVRQADGLPALPWGAGKWLGARKRVLTDYLGRHGEEDLFLADNGCRPSFWPFPLYARKAGPRLLAGSDPLPFPWEARRAGSFGISLRGDIDEGAPAASLRELLRDRWQRPQPYGRTETSFRFFRNQAAMQIHKNFLAAGLS